MQGVDAGMQGVDDRMQAAYDRMQAAYDRMQAACSLHASLVWPRLNRDLNLIYSLPNCHQFWSNQLSNQSQPAVYSTSMPQRDKLGYQKY